MEWDVSDSRGASSVVGILLLIAVTVILATVVATFALDIGSDSTNEAPQVSWEYDYNGGDIQATHESGDAVEAAALSVEGVEGSCAGSITTTGTVTSGDTITLGDGSCATSGVTIQIIWDDPETDNSAILGEFSN